jgi:hypothetical protein
MLVKVVSRSAGIFGMIWFFGNSYRLHKHLLMPLKKNICGSKSGHKTMFGRDWINYVSLTGWCLSLMRGKTLFWKCMWRLGILENNKHLLKSISDIIGIIELNKLGPLSRLVRSVN